MRLLAVLTALLASFMPLVAMEDADSLRRALMAREMAMNAPGTAAAGFDLELADGTRATLGDFLGRPLLLVLFDADCPTCAERLEQLPRLVPAGLRVLAVYAEPDDALRAAAFAEVPPQFTAALDRTGVYADDLYSPEFTPGIYLIDAAGVVVARGDDPAEMRAAMLEIAE